MIIEITGRHGSVTEGLKQHARDRLDQSLKHAPSVVSAHVILDSEKERQMAEMIVTGPGLTATVHAESDDAYLSVDRCAEKLRSQLEKLLGKRKDRRRKGHSHEARVEAELAAMAEAMARAEEAGGTLATPIVRASVRLQALRQEEALERLPSAEDGLLLYRDADTERLSVLFQREDGSLVVLEAEPEQA
jgi:putative sigma-54 modulation protein